MEQSQQVIHSFSRWVSLLLLSKGIICSLDVFLQCVQVLSSLAVVPILHTALSYLKALRCRVLYSISESRASRYSRNEHSYSMPELECFMTYFCLCTPQAGNMQDSTLKCISYDTRTNAVIGCHILNEVILQWWWGLNWHFSIHCFILGILVSRYCEF